MKCRAGLTEKKRLQPYFQQTNYSRSDTLQATKLLTSFSLLALCDLSGKENREYRLINLLFSLSS